MMKDTVQILTSAALSIGLVLAINLTIAWFAGSAITSGVKSISGSCGSRYPIEGVFSGDWFCAVEVSDD